MLGSEITGVLNSFTRVQWREKIGEDWEAEGKETDGWLGLLIW